ncbi:hypothetical protein FA13DRAFT_1779929 [Coprinellus micaceus]|uniref:Uncharacterized protein n=1 Tax=Coprinellus micaceus TaxID=71717 RepID=A0A4Y7SFD6_COPMI|nr:hypothetical protein FA13DRAFT_1779929 [Coprinellus micaceus]
MSTTPGGISPITQVLETEELIGTILQILACLVRQDLRVNLHDWLNSNSSHIKYRGRRPQWTNFFARVALVNRAFFHASVGVLWEHVNDFHPFFALLESCSTGKRTLEDTNEGVPVALLERFKFYSSRTKSLTLHSRSTTPEKAWWITYMLNSRTTDDHSFFPALRNLYLQTTDNFSLMIASFVSSRLEYLSFEFDTEPKRKAKQRLLKLVEMVSSGAWPISMLRVHHVILSSQVWLDGADQGMPIRNAGIYPIFLRPDITSKDRGIALLARVMSMINTRELVRPG